MEEKEVLKLEKVEGQEVKLEKVDDATKEDLRKTFQKSMSQIRRDKKELDTRHENAYTKKYEDRKEKKRKLKVRKKTQRVNRIHGKKSNRMRKNNGCIGRNRKRRR